MTRQSLKDKQIGDELIVILTECTSSELWEVILFMIKVNTLKIRLVWKMIYLELGGLDVEVIIISKF